MGRIRIHQFNKTIDNDFTSSKDSIMIPTNVKKVVAICPTLQNGTGILSIYKEESNEEVLNQVTISDDNLNWKDKNIPILVDCGGENFFYVLRLLDSNINKRCELKLSISYEEEDK